MLQCTHTQHNNKKIVVKKIKWVILLVIKKLQNIMQLLNKCLQKYFKYPINYFQPHKEKCCLVYVHILDGVAN
jgi:hypothetical protein